MKNAIAGFVRLRDYFLHNSPVEPVGTQSVVLSRKEVTAILAAIDALAPVASGEKVIVRKTVIDSIEEIENPIAAMGKRARESDVKLDGTAAKEE